MAKWLDKYEQGGLVLKKKTKDNYGTKPNVNDVKVSAGPNFVGEGYTAYNWKSPAWGGQFQHGGILGKTFLQPNDPKLPVGWNPKEKGYSTEYSTTIGTDGEYYLVPGFKHGKLLSDPEKEFRSTGELLGGPFKTIQSANDFANRRHKYVEKGQPLPSPMKTYDEFQMGGSMPGTVGFMYARTQNPAPSNGKYAKKTQASAQNGQEMKFYQDGLDFKPKSISKNGAILDPMGQWAHPGEVTIIPSNDITMQGVDYPVLGVSDTGDTKIMYPDQDYKFNGSKVTEYPIAQKGIFLDKYPNTSNDNIPTTASVQKKIIEREEYNQQKAIQAARDKQGYIEKAGPRQSPVSKAWSILTNPMTAVAYKVKGKELPDHFEMGPRNVLDYAVDFVNPYGVADAVANIPRDLSRGDFGSAALNTLAALPALHEVGALGKAAKTAKAVNELSKAKNLKEAAGYLVKGIPVEKSLPRLAEGELKTFRQIQEIPKMAEAGKSRAEQMKYAIENNIPDTHFERIFQMPKQDAQNLLNSGFGERPAVDREALRNRFRQLDLQQQERVNVPLNPSVNARETWINEINDLTTEPYFGTRIEPAPDFYENLGHRTVPTSYDQMTDSEVEALRNHLFDRYMSARRTRIANENNILGDDFDIDRDFVDMSEPYPRVELEDVIDRQYFPTKKQNIGDKLTKAETKIKGKLKNFIENATQNYPYYSGEVEEKVPSLFRSQEKSLTDVSRKVAKQTENIPSGTVYTGSSNTSHNSWLPQVKQIFNYKGGTPQFIGYKPMNSLGYLSKAQVPEEDIVKYLNSEMDELVKKGKLPKNVQRPIMYKGHPVLPQYAIKQNKNGGWLNKYK